MTETTPGVTAIAVDAPLPRDAAGAAALRELLTANAEYMANWKDDQGKQSTLAYLRWVGAGQDPDRWGKPPETDSDVYAQQGARGALLAEQHGEAIDQHFDLTAEQKHEVLARRPMLQSEKDYAAREMNKNLRDKAWLERRHQGDRVARTEEYLLNCIKSAPLARSQADIDAWIAAHPFTPRSG